jgi:hypothetical protein
MTSACAEHARYKAACKTWPFHSISTQSPPTHNAQFSQIGLRGQGKTETIGTVTECSDIGTPKSTGIPVARCKPIRVQSYCSLGSFPGFIWASFLKIAGRSSVAADEVASLTTLHIVAREFTQDQFGCDVLAFL